MSLSVRERIKDSVKKGGLSNNELHHPSRAYERHFEGYVEKSEPVPGKKRSKAVRTYVDSIWVQELSARQRLRRRVLYVVLYLLALPPFLYSATRLIDANTVWFVTLPQAVSVLTLGWTALNLYRYCTAPREMTVRQHRLGPLWLQRTVCVSWIALFVMAAGYLICAAWICAVWSLLSCFCLLALFLIERNVAYTEQANPLAEER